MDENGHVNIYNAAFRVIRHALESPPTIAEVCRVGSFDLCRVLCKIGAGDQPDWPRCGLLVYNVLRVFFQGAVVIMVISNFRGSYFRLHSC
jgi:hypothetical protein